MISGKWWLGFSLLFLAIPGFAAEMEVIRTSWGGFGEQTVARKLLKKDVEITLLAGNRFRTRLLAVEEQGLQVEKNKATRSWSDRGDQALVPREQIRSVRFLGRKGHHGLLGGLIGLGAGLAVPAIALRNVEEGSYGLLALPLLGMGIGGVSGYVIGYYTDRKQPEFIIERQPSP